MKKLSDSAQLYFKDYFILSSLQDEVHDYLDKIIEQSSEIMKKIEINDYLKDNEERVRIPKSKSGEFEVYYQFDKINNNYGKFPSISIMYRDLRKEQKDFPNDIRIYLYIWGKDAQPFKDKLNTVDNTIFKDHELHININDIEETVKNITNKIIEIIRQIESAVKELEIKNNI